jgi:hypothetical protein
VAFAQKAALENSTEEAGGSCDEIVSHRIIIRRIATKRRRWLHRWVLLFRIIGDPGDVLFAKQVNGT